MKQLLLIPILFISVISFGQDSFKRIFSILPGYFFHNSNQVRPNALLTLDGNGYAFVGIESDWDGVEWGIFVVLNNKGEILKKMKFAESGSFSSFFTSLNHTSDNGFLISGHSQNSIQFLMKLDYLGNVVWSKDIDPTFGKASIISEDNNIILSSNTSLMKLDSDGNFLWANNAGGGLKIIKSLDENFITAGSNQILKFSPEGDTLWRRTYGGVDIKDIDITLDESYICSSRNSNGDDVIFKVDSLGEVVWSYAYDILPSNPWLTFQYANIVRHTADNNFIVCSRSNDRTIFYKLDNLGEIIWSKELITFFDGSHSRHIDMQSTVDGGFAILNGEEYAGGSYETISLHKLNENGEMCGEESIPYSLNKTFYPVSVSIPILTINSTNYINNNLYFFNSLSEISVLSNQIISPPICIVSVDSTSTKNRVVWEKPISQSIENFNIYREYNSGVYGVVGSVHYDSLSEFYDNTIGVNPNITSYRYKISVSDTCGNESVLSDFHETMHLSTNLSPNGDVNLIWDGYEGFPITYYRILRDSTENNEWEVLDSVSNNIFIWTDINPPSIGAEYLIEVLPPNICTSTKAQDHNSTRSNRANIIEGGGQGQSILQKPNSNLTIYPNPTSDQITIDIKGYSGVVNVEVYDLQGRLLETTTNTSLSLKQHAKGIYVIKVSYGDITEEVRVVRD